MRLARVALGLAVVAGAAAVGAGSSDANWLSRLVREGAEVGGEAGVRAGGKLGLGALDMAAAHVARLPRLSKGTALAAHVTPEGHWKFVNREGDVFTAATPDELARVTSTLAPDAKAGDGLSLYLSEDTVFAGRSSLKDLPPDAELHIVAGNDSYRLRNTSGSAADGLVAEFRPNVVVALEDRKLFEEAVFSLARPLNRSNIRVLALEPGGPRALSSVPRFEPSTKAALVDQIDPTSLPAALSSLKGQTAVVSGRIEGGSLTFRPSSGAEQTLDIKTLVAAAEQSDVNLVLIEASAAHQPGGRNWLWQKIAVAGLDDALNRASFADFLSSLGGAGSELTVRAAPGSPGRIVISAVPVPNATTPLTDTLSGWIGEVTGNVAVKSAEVYARDEARQRELDTRIIPGIPATVQYTYLVSLVLGILAYPVSGAWWSRVWPQEQRKEYAGRLGYFAARGVRLLVFLGVFLPLVGSPAFFWSCVLHLWGILTIPFRGWSWLHGRLAQRRN